MLETLITDYHLILASGSPRRQELIKTLGLDHEIRLKPVEEVYPEHLKYNEISDYLAELKANPFKDELQANDILLTSDTIVWHNDQAVEKPKSLDEAFQMIRSMSGDQHEVVTSVCLTTTKKQITVHDITKVTFKSLTDEEIWYYVNNYPVMDKAGAYGVQDWLGLTAVTKIEGSYFNVMGLPVHLVYKTLKELIQDQ